MISSKISTQITKLRESKGWTKKQLAIKSKVSQTYISEIEAGKKNPTIKILEKISKALGVQISKLMDEETT